jgi:hypothetical protein
MRPKSLSICLLLLTPWATHLAAQNTVKAVIGLNSSQLIESLNQNTELSLPPIEGSIIPLINTQPIAVGRINEAGKNWQRYINQTVKIINRQSQLTYEGRLLSSNQVLFEILVDNQRLQLHLSDYNLSLPYKGSTLSPSFSINDQLTYQTYDVSWQPQLSIFLDDEYATLKQNALIKNTSFNDVLLAQPILQLKQHQSAPAPIESMNLRGAKMLSDSGSVDYVNNEITVPTNQDILLPAQQTLLFPFKQQKLKIMQSRLIAEHYANPRSHSEQSISFEQHADLILEQDAMPGSYKTYWRFKDYLLPAGMTELAHLRQGNRVTLKINQSQDIQATFKLMKASSMKLPAKQTWQLTLTNLSNKNQTIEFYHNANGLIEHYQVISSDELVKLELESANRLKLSYLLVPNEDIDIQYDVNVTH